MSKIFDALRRGKGEIPDLVLPALGESAKPPSAEPEPQAPPLAAAFGAIEDLTPPLGALPDDTQPVAASAAATLVSAPVAEPEAVAPAPPVLVPDAEPAAEAYQDEPVPELPREPVILPPGVSCGYRVVRVEPRPDSPVLPFDQSKWLASEQYRILRTKVVQHPRQPRMICVSSGGPGDGKSVTAINLAGALALRPEATALLLEVDFRRSVLSSMIGIPETPGLADLMLGLCTLEECLIRCEQYPNLYFIPAGETDLNPAELLDSSNWPALCARLRKLFKFVVMDTPPVAAVADYDLIQAVSDGVILVVRPDQTSRKVAFRALDAVPKDKMLGVVLNSLQNWFFGKTYEYYSYYYKEHEKEDKQAARAKRKQRKD